MPSALEAANAKLSEDQFKTLFDNPRIGSHNNKEVLQWTYHNPNGSDETLWVPLKTKDNQSLPTSKVKNNIHNKCSEVKKQLAAPSIPHPNTVSQTSIHGRLQPTYQHSVSRGASSELTTNACSSGTVEEFYEHYAPDGSVTRHMKRAVEVHEETTTLKNQVVELKEQVQGLEFIADERQDDICRMSEYHKKEDESWNEERVWYTDKLAKLHAELEAEKEKVKYARVKRVRVEASKQTVEKSAPPPDKPLEFDPSTAPIGEWTTEGLMEFFLHPSVKTRDPAQWMPELVAILDENLSCLYKSSLHCKLRSNDGQTKSLWMPQTFVYLNNEYHKIWQAFKREQDIDPSWDVDWDKAEEEDKKKEAKEQARNDRKRKQEVEERAAKRRTGMCSVPRSSAAPLPSRVSVKLSTCDTSSSISSSKLVKLEVQAKGKYRTLW